MIQVGTAMSAHFLTESPQGDNATNEQAAQTHEKESSNSVALDRTTTHSIDMSIPKKTYRERMALVTNTPGTLKEFLRHLYQPLIVLCTLPAVTYTAVQYGAALSWYSIIGTSSATYFPAAPYNFGTVGIGLLNLPPFIGCALSAIFAGPLSDWSIQVLAKRNKGIYEPEMRLYLITIPTLLVPLGIFIYGYSVANGDHWIVPCVGYAIFAFGNASIYGLSLTYLVDCYREVRMQSSHHSPHALTTLQTGTDHLTVRSPETPSSALLSFGTDFLLASLMPLLRGSHPWGSTIRSLRQAVWH